MTDPALVETARSAHDESVGRAVSAVWRIESA
jgi:hypothetical protein